MPCEGSRGSQGPEQQRLTTLEVMWGRDRVEQGSSQVGQGARRNVEQGEISSTRVL